MSSEHSYLPLYLQGKVVSGYARGSKELGFPTANLDKLAFEKLAEKAMGVYFGLAQVVDEPVQEMVMSIGWNPFYQNKEKSVEVHILKKYDEDFYGSHLKVIVLGFIRPMLNFTSVEELISAIEGDIKYAKKELTLPHYSNYKTDLFWAN